MTAKNPIKKLRFNDMTLPKMDELFGLRKVHSLKALEVWTQNDCELSTFEMAIANYYQKILIEHIHIWQEQELSLHFIGPILSLNHFRIPYQLNLFAERPITASINQYELSGKPDHMVAAGEYEPTTPFFCFQAYKKDMDSSGDPRGQNLAAMLVGQTLNKNTQAIYGCYVVGRLWYFMVLQGKEYAISREYVATQKDLSAIVKCLKWLKQHLQSKLSETV